MQETTTPRTPEELAETLRALRLKRRELRRRLGEQKPRRSALSRRQRERVLEKTTGRCHICGGEIDGKWHADHVLAHSGGGRHSIDNYLPAHEQCNGYRWDFTGEEFQYILRIGVWARTQMERQTLLGKEAAARFVRHEHARERRRQR